MKRARIEIDGLTAWATQATNGSLRLDSGRCVAEDAVRYLPPVEPTKIIATNVAFLNRVNEYGLAPPIEPSYFLKPPNTLAGHRDPVARPPGCSYLNYEGEIAVVIGERCSGATLQDALKYVSGYTVANDWGAHDYHHADRSMLRVKGLDGYLPIGPFVVDAADVDPNDLTIRTFVNGELVQEGHSGRDLLFSFAYQIADISRLITLEPGDVLLTGTPSNSRPADVGDLVAVEVEGIGRLENTVVELSRTLEPLGHQPRVTSETLRIALAMRPEETERGFAVLDS